MENSQHFIPSETLLGFDDWERCVETKRKTLAPIIQEWLADWSRWDLACSPMPDHDRKRIRYGHYLGWMSYHINQTSANNAT